MLSILTLVHVVAATVGLLSGFLAMSLRKGSGWHGAAGRVSFDFLVRYRSRARARRGEMDGELQGDRIARRAA